jgi:hypothetical protein
VKWILIESSGIPGIGSWLDFEGNSIEFFLVYGALVASVASDLPFFFSSFFFSGVCEATGLAGADCLSKGFIYTTVSSFFLPKNLI